MPEDKKTTPEPPVSQEAQPHQTAQETKKPQDEAHRFQDWASI